MRSEPLPQAEVRLEREWREVLQACEKTRGETRGVGETEPEGGGGKPKRSKSKSNPKPRRAKK